MDISKLADEVQNHLRRTVMPLVARLRSLEDWRATMPAPQKGDPGERGEPGRDGKDFDPALVEIEVRRAVAALPPPAAGRDGKDGRDGRDGATVEVETVRALVREAVADLPPAQAGKDGRDGANGRDGKDGEPGQRGEPGINGKDGAPGKDGTPGERGEPGLVGKDGAPGQRGERGEPGERGLPGEPGRPGERGEQGAPGQRGEKGDPGRDGKDADPEHVRACVERAVADALPGLIEKAVAARLEAVSAEWVAKAALLVPPGRDGLPGRPGERGDDGRDGRPGQDGRDGISPEDIGLSMKDGRAVVLTFKTAAGEIVRELPLDGMPIDRGVFKSGAAYRRGDGVTYGGSYWFCTADTDKPPPGDGWRLAVKGTR